MLPGIYVIGQKDVSLKHRGLRRLTSLIALILGFFPLIAVTPARSMGTIQTPALDETGITLAQADRSTDPDVAAQARYDEALRAALANPTDVEANFELAEAAVAVGDLNTAIAALERILLVQPDRPDIKLRLGQLYQRVGAYELAGSYLGSGLESRDVPQVIRENC